MEDVLSITSPEELSARLQRLQLEKKELLEFFYIVATRRRIGLMEVFFNPSLYQDGYEGITLQDLFSDPPTFVALLEKIIEEGRIDIIAYFLNKGLNANFGVIVDGEIATVLTGSPLLSLACLAKKIDIMELPLKRGADPNQSDDNYETPASYAN